MDVNCNVGMVQVMSGTWDSHTAKICIWNLHHSTRIHGNASKILIYCILRFLLYITSHCLFANFPFRSCQEAKLRALVSPLFNQCLPCALLSIAIRACAQMKTLAKRSREIMQMINITFWSRQLCILLLYMTIALEIQINIDPYT
jgi:hypothetical protein